MDKLEKLKKIVDVLDSDRASSEEVAQVFAAMIETIKELNSKAEEAREIGDKEVVGTCMEFINKLAISQERLGRLTVEFRDTSKKGLDDLARKVFDEITIVKSLIPSIKDWAYLEQQIKEVEGKMPTVPEELSNEQLRDKLESLEGDSRTDKSAIKGIEEIEEKIGKLELRPIGGTFGGGTRGVQLYVGGVKKGLAYYFDFVAGPNMTISDSLVNGLHTITFTSTGGSGFTELPATETPDGSRTQFTFATASAQPSFLVVDNVWMKAVTASGTVNWTWNGGTKVATLSVPSSDDIFGVV